MNKILVIDDEIGPRESLRILLKHDYEVRCVDNVDEGLSALKEMSPDVIVMDIRMPKKTGIEGLREIRQIDPHVSVIMLTGFGALETAQEALRLGANDYLKKPFDTTEMQEVIRRNVQRSQLERRRIRAIGELKDLNNQLLTEMVEKEHMALLGQTSAELVHDLRNPLTIVLGYVQLLSDQLQCAEEKLGIGYNEAAEYLDVIEKNVQRCHDLSQMWQQFGKADLSKLEPLSVKDMLNDIVIGVQPLAAAENVKIEYNSCCQNLFVNGSRPQLLRAIHNIISNAVHAVSENGSITVKCEQVEAQAMITVSDNGCGMTEEQLKKVFEPYYTTKESGKGTGLGLHITKKIIEEHEGSISFSSVVGEGTKAKISLPILTE